VAEPDLLRDTRTSYDAVADDFTEQFCDELSEKPLDRALLALFAELVQAAGGGPVADVGCGTGRVTTHMHGFGMDVSGIDLSPQMIEVARRSQAYMLARKG